MPEKKSKESPDAVNSYPALSEMPAYEFFHANLNYSFYVENEASSVVSGQYTAPAKELPSEGVSEPPSLQELLKEDEPRYATAEQICPVVEENSSTGMSVGTGQPDAMQASDEIEFSDQFDFNASLLKIFWRIDVDRNNRVNRAELECAVRDHWFTGDEEVLALALLGEYDEIMPGPMIADAGLSVAQILNFAPFCQLAQSTMGRSREQPSNNSWSEERASKKKKKSMQVLFEKSRFRR